VVQQATALSPSDRTVLEVSLSRMSGDAFGALTTLPLYCLGDLPSPDPRAVVLDHYDIWHSCLVVAREVLRSDARQPERVPRALDNLLNTATELRDAYIDLSTSRAYDEPMAKNACSRLVAAYERLPLLVQELSSELELDDSFLPSPRSVKRAAIERTLRWLADEVQSRAGKL
jgi:hypothetical protein